MATYTLTADVKVLAATGPATALLAHRLLSPAVGTIEATGPTTSLLARRLISPAVKVAHLWGCAAALRAPSDIDGTETTVIQPRLASITLESFAQMRALRIPENAGPLLVYRVKPDQTITPYIWTLDLALADDSAAVIVPSRLPRTGCFQLAGGIFSSLEAASAVFGPLTATTTTLSSLTVANNVNLFTTQGGGWDDVLGQIVIPTVGANRPTLANWAGSAVFEGWRFAINDRAHFDLHFKHGTITGSPVHLHCHWTSDGVDVNTVKWEFTYTYARGYGQDHFDPVGTVVSATGTPDGTAYGHYITEIVAPIELATIEPDGMMMVKLRRITNGGVENADGIFVEKCDAHHQNNAIYTKNKNTPFYS